MAQRRPPRPSSNLTRIEPSPRPTQPAPTPGSNSGWIAIIAIVALFAVVSRCSSSTTSNSSADTTMTKEVGNAQTAVASAVAAQSLPPVQPLSGSGVRRGAMRVDLAAKEGLAGEMIYSQNCYDALGRSFTWKKLDECGGFDIEAGLTLGDESQAGSEKEVAWFDGEAAAGRYLKAATAAGQDADAADQRLATLQAQVGHRHPAGSPSQPTEQNDAKPVEPPTPQADDNSSIPAEQATG